MGFIIDTGFFIAAERAGADWITRVQQQPAEPIAIAAITVAELLHGVHRADTPSRRQRRQQWVESVVNRVPVAVYNTDVARIHAQLWAELQTRGMMIGLHDLIIAATCLTLGYKLVSANEREFAQVTGLVIDNWLRPSS